MLTNGSSKVVLQVPHLIQAYKNIMWSKIGTAVVYIVVKIGSMQQELYGYVTCFQMENQSVTQWHRFTSRNQDKKIEHVNGGAIECSS